MMKYLFALLFTITVSVIITGCDRKPSFYPEWDSNHSQLMITYKLYETEGEMLEALQMRLGYAVVDIHGMAIMSADDNICEVYALVPKRIDDQRTLTIGHESLHCVYGRYHEE